jgi:predicted dehydrogenase
MTSQKVRFALVGVGGMGRTNATRILEDGRGEIVAICDANRETAKQAAADLHVSAVFSDVEALLSSKTKFEAAVVATTNATHAPISVALLEAGKSVYCEKPPASDVAGAENIAAAASKAKGTIMFGFNQRFDPWAQYAKKQVERGELGTIYHAQTQWHRRLWTWTFGSWFTDRKLSGGGPLMDIGIHRLDQTLWLMDFPEVLSVSGVAYDYLAKAESERIEKSCTIEDFSACLIRLEGGVSLILQSSYLSYLPLDAQEMSTLVMGTECGLLECGGVLRQMSNQGPSPSDILIKQFDEPPVTPMGSFLDSVLNGEPSICTAEQGLTVMQVIDAIYRSAVSGTEVTLSGRERC